MRASKRAPRTVGDLTDEQVDRWREGDNRVFDEDRKGRPLTQRATRRRDTAERRGRAGRGGR